MEKEWIPVITALIVLVGTLFGALFGGSISTFIKWFEIENQKFLENRKMRLSKMEELYLILEHFPGELLKTIENHIEKPEIIYSKPSDYLMHYGDVNLYMIVDYYIPELKSKINELDELVFEMMSEYRSFSQKQRGKILDWKLHYENFLKDIPNLLTNIDSQLSQLDLPNEIRVQLERDRRRIVDAQSSFETFHTYQSNYKLLRKEDSTSDSFFSKFLAIDKTCEEMQNESKEIARKLISVKPNPIFRFLFRE